MRSATSVDRQDRGDDTGSCAHRGPGDDFFCLRFQVWYPSIDCAVRTRFRTCGGCLNCDQGRFNLRRHTGKIDGLWFGRRGRRSGATSSSSGTV